MLDEFVHRPFPYLLIHWLSFDVSKKVKTNVIGRDNTFKLGYQVVIMLYHPRNDTAVINCSVISSSTSVRRFTAACDSFLPIWKHSWNSETSFQACRKAGLVRNWIKILCQKHVNVEITFKEQLQNADFAAKPSPRYQCHISKASDFDGEVWSSWVYGGCWPFDMCFLRHQPKRFEVWIILCQKNRDVQQWYQGLCSEQPVMPNPLKCQKRPRSQHGSRRKTWTSIILTSNLNVFKSFLRHTLLDCGWKGLQGAGIITTL